jgi:hypothetical protein
MDFPSFSHRFPHRHATPNPPDHGDAAEPGYRGPARQGVRVEQSVTPDLFLETCVFFLNDFFFSIFGFSLVVFFGIYADFERLING